MKETVFLNRQRFGGVAAIVSAVLFIIVMFLTQTVAMSGIKGEDVYEKTVNSLATYPILNWALMIIGLFAILILFSTVEAIEERLRTSFPNMSSNVSRFAYFHLLTYALYMLLPAAVLHDLANEDKNIAESLEVIHSITELGLVLSALSCIILSIWLFRVGFLSLKTKMFSRPLGIFSIITSCIVLFSGGYEALYGRGMVFGIIASILTFVCGFVVWKIWIGIELLRGSKKVTQTK